MTKDKYDQFAFHHEKCSGFLEKDSDGIICKSCQSTLHLFRKKCSAKGASERNCNLNTLMKSNIYHSTSSHEKAKEVITEMSRRHNNLRNQKYRLQIKYDSLLNRTGVDISLEQSTTLFDNQTKELYTKFLDENISSVSQSELIKYICCKSWENAETARKKGKKNVRYCPIIIKFASYLKSKTGNSGYSFLSNVFTLPSCSTVDRYATLDSNAQDGILYETLDDMKQSLDLLLKTEHTNSSQERKDWACKGVLKFDEMKVKEKIVFNQHTNEIIGFVDGGIDVDVLKKEMIDMSNDETAGKNKKNLPPIAKHFLLFMFCRWDNVGNPMKRSVARYSVSNSTGEGLARKIIPIITALFTRGFIVNQVTFDGASENVSAMKQLGTITAEEAFADLVRNTKLPKDMKVGFYHPIKKDVVIYIGGEMPHWVKKFVNAMENSSKENSKRDLTYRNCKINLGMIHHVWASHQSQINSLQVVRKLTEDHFVKNPHSRMRVYLATQVLSQNVLQMIEDYCADNEEEKQRYSSLLLCVKYLDTLVDICNHPIDKNFKRDPEGNRYECITSDNHEYIKYLEEILKFFSDWDNESRNEVKDLNNFIPKTLFESFAWLVYGLKGVASQIPKGCAMVQRRGGTDHVEHEFSYIRHKNPNPGIADARGMIGQQTGFRSTNFAKNVKTNTRGDRMIPLDELREAKKRKT